MQSQVRSRIGNKEITDDWDLEQIRCALCDSTESLPIANIERNLLPLHTVVCSLCGLVFINPRPSKAWYRHFYMHLYRKFYFGADRPTIENANSPRALFKHRSNLEFVEPFLQETGSVLDIGSGDGSFMRLFRDQFPEWDLTGIEPNEQFVEFAREQFGLKNVYPGEFPSAIDGDKRFDLIHTSHVVEHILDPNGFLSSCRECLQPGGLLFVDVPNADSLRKGIRFLHVGHVYHYTHSTLCGMLEKWGFEVIAYRDDVVEPWHRRMPPWSIQVIGRKLDHVPETSCIPQADANEIAVRLRKQWRMDLLRRAKFAFRRG